MVWLSLHTAIGRLEQEARLRRQRASLREEGYCSSGSGSGSDDSDICYGRRSGGVDEHTDEDELTNLMDHGSDFDDESGIFFPRSRCHSTGGIKERMLMNLHVRENDSRGLGTHGAQVLSQALQRYVDSAGGRSCSLRRLSLYSNNLGDDGLLALRPAFSSLAKLVDLNLRSNNISASGAKVLAQLPKLRRLDLGYNHLGDEGVKALQLHRLVRLRSLYLFGNGITHVGASIILFSSQSHVQELLLQSNAIGGSDSSWPSDSQTLPSDRSSSIRVNDNLRALYLDDNGITTRQAQQLLAITGTNEHSLEILSLRDNDIDSSKITLSNTIAFLDIQDTRHSSLDPNHSSTLPTPSHLCPNTKDQQPFQAWHRERELADLEEDEENDSDGDTNTHDQTGALGDTDEPHFQEETTDSNGNKQQQQQQQNALPFNPPILENGIHQHLSQAIRSRSTTTESEEELKSCFSHLPDGDNLGVEDFAAVDGDDFEKSDDFLAIYGPEANDEDFIFGAHLLPADNAITLLEHQENKKVIDEVHLTQLLKKSSSTGQIRTATSERNDYEPGTVTRAEETDEVNWQEKQLYTNENRELFFFPAASEKHSRDFASDFHFGSEDEQSFCAAVQDELHEMLPQEVWNLQNSEDEVGKKSGKRTKPSLESTYAVVRELQQVLWSPLRLLGEVGLRDDNFSVIPELADIEFEDGSQESDGDGHNMKNDEAHVDQLESLYRLMETEGWDAKNGWSDDDSKSFTRFCSPLYACLWRLRTSRHKMEDYSQQDETNTKKMCSPFATTRRLTSSFVSLFLPPLKKLRSRRNFSETEHTVTMDKQSSSESRQFSLNSQQSQCDRNKESRDRFPTAETMSSMPPTDILPPTKRPWVTRTLCLLWLASTHAGRTNWPPIVLV